MTPLWQAFYEPGGDVVLAGHTHLYERFAPKDPQARRRRSPGHPSVHRRHRGPEHVRLQRGRAQQRGQVGEAFGVLTLRLHPTSYDWGFVAQPGRSFTDAGSQSCH